MIILASFLAGSLLSLLLPVGVLIAIVAWHMTVIRRVPRELDSPELRATVRAGDPPQSSSSEPAPSPSEG